jgi:hypothetical protein
MNEPSPGRSAPHPNEPHLPIPPHALRSFLPLVDGSARARPPRAAQCNPVEIHSQRFLERLNPETLALLRRSTTGPTRHRVLPNNAGVFDQSASGIRRPAHSDAGGACLRTAARIIPTRTHVPASRRLRERPRKPPRDVLRWLFVDTRSSSGRSTPQSPARRPMLSVLGSPGLIPSGRLDAI